MRGKSRVIILALAVAAGAALCVVAWQVLGGSSVLWAPPGPASADAESGGGGPRIPEPLPEPPRNGRSDPAPVEGSPPTLSEARSFHELGEEMEALDCLDRILKADPDNVEALLLRGAVYLGLPQMERRAEQDLKRALEKGGESPGLLDSLAAASFRRAPADAVRRLERSIELDPTRAGPHALRARLELRRGDRKEARSAAERALALDPRNELARTILERLSR